MSYEEYQKLCVGDIVNYLDGEPYKISQIDERSNGDWDFWLTDNSGSFFVAEGCHIEKI